MTLTFNSSGSGNSAHALTGNLNFAVVNIHLPTGPIVREFEFEDNPIPAGQGFTLNVPNVPAGSFLVQFLGIYEADGQASKFAYGDATAMVTLGASNEVNIVTAEIGSFSKEGRVSGRYFASATAPYGPTGDLVMQFQPPDLSKPKMNIHPFPIVQGWFSIMALDGAKMDYVLMPGNEVIFKDVRLNGSTLEIDGISQATGASLAKFISPAHFVLETGDGDIRSIPPSDIWVGYFKKSTLSASILSGKQVCAANAVEEAVPGAYLIRSGNVLSVPLEVDLDTGTASEIRRNAGGVTASLADLYAETGVGCTATGANKITVYHNMLSDDGDRAIGMSPPFKAIRPFARWDQYIAVSYAEPASVPTLKVEWKFIPGLDSTALTGVALLAKYSANGGGGGGGDKRCEDLIGQGYTVAGTTNTLSAESFLFTGLPGGSALVANDKYSWSFALCAFHEPSLGTRRYVGRPVRGGHLGNSGDEVHTGWAPAFKTLTATSAAYDYQSEGGDSHKVNSVNSTGSPLYTALTVNETSTLVAGDEAMFTIVGSSGAGACGTHNGDTNYIGKYGFARVIGVSSGITVKVAKGSFVDQMEPVNTAIGETDHSQPFCHVQISKVLHYRDLDLSAATDFNTYSGGNTAFNYAATPFGQIPIRVNGVLTLGSSINASGAGFTGGTGSFPTAAGTAGPSRASGANGTGGQGNMPNGAGGAGFGSGGAGGGPAVATPGYSSGPMNGLGLMIFGGGGGHGNASDGGHGGGNVFIVARETYVGGPSVINVNGLAGSGSEGGGGAGGSAIFLTGKISGAGSLSIYARGGNGASSAGVGGGGAVHALACTGSTSLVADALKGASGNVTGANDGMMNIMSPSSQYHMCQLIQ